MRLLLDTHIFLWSLIEPERLVSRVASELEKPSNELWLSPITTWETLVLVDKGRVVLDSDPTTWLRRVLSQIPFKEAPVNYEVSIQSRVINLPHQDPADRFLAATAVVYDLTLVTSDERLLVSKEYAILANK